MNIKILSISDSPIINEYLKEKLSEQKIDLIAARDGFDGIVKMRNLHPELIIMDFNIPKMTINQFLLDKQELKGTQDIPIILLYSKNDRIDKNLILNLAKSKIYRLFLKPIDINVLYNSINQIFKINLETDKGDCQINVNLNKGNILFVEVSKGLNQEKLDLMKYNIIELNKNRKNNSLKGLLVISDMVNNYDLNKMLEGLIYNITSSAGLSEKDITVLTMDENVKFYFKNEEKFREIAVSTDYNEVMKKFDIHPTAELKNVAEEKKQTVSGANFFPSKVGEINQPSRKKDTKIPEIAIINNDNFTSIFLKKIFAKKGWSSSIFNSGLMFLKTLNRIKPDLIVMDLIFSEISGFELLKYIRKSYQNIPVIILTSITNKEYILKARDLGVRYYLTKPVNPAIIIEKLEDCMKDNSSYMPDSISLFNDRVAEI